MGLPKEIDELLDYLEPREDYAIFAGFAAFLHVGLEPSPDVDIYVSAPKRAERIARGLSAGGWARTRTESGEHLLLNTLAKGETTLDIMYSALASRCWLPTREVAWHQGRRLLVISPEALLLTKMNMLSWVGRASPKLERDRATIDALRKKIDTGRLRGLIAGLPDPFWTEGQI